MSLLLLPKKLEKNLESQIPLLEDGIMRIKLQLKEQLVENDYIYCQKLLEQQKKKLIKNLNQNTVIAEFPQINKIMTCNDKLNSCKKHILSTLYYQTLALVLIGKEKTLTKFWMNPLIIQLKNWLSLIKIDCVASIMDYWNKSLEFVKLNSWFSIIMNINQPNKNYLKTLCPLYTYLIADKWENGDTSIKTPIMKTKKIKIALNKNQRQIVKKWIGTYRYTYNKCVDSIKNKKEKVNFMDLRNKLVTKEHLYYTDKNKNKLQIRKTGKLKDKMTDDEKEKLKNERKKYELIKEPNDLPEWLFETPKDIRASSIKECVNAYKTNFKENHPFDIKFKSKKEIQETINIPKTAIKINKDNIEMYKSFGMGKIKIKEEIISIDHDIQLTYIKPNIFYLLIPVNIEKKDIQDCDKKITAIDLGLRTFATGIGLDGSVYKIGNGSYKKIKNKLKLIDKLKSKLSKLKNTKERLKYLRTKNILNLAWFKLNNMITDLHWRTIKFVTDNYDYVIVGKFDVRNMLKKNAPNFNKMLLSFKHYKFIQKLKFKCKELNKKLIITNEAYTSKTCSNCGVINMEFNTQKVYRCNMCESSIDRDINGAINILYKTLLTK